MFLVCISVTGNGIVSFTQFHVPLLGDCAIMNWNQTEAGRSFSLTFSRTLAESASECAAETAAECASEGGGSLCVWIEGGGGYAASFKLCYGGVKICGSVRKNETCHIYKRSWVWSLAGQRHYPSEMVFQTVNASPIPFIGNAIILAIIV